MKKAVIGIVFDDTRTQVLCIKRRDVPVWVLPGGGVDSGESMEGAVVREIQEETGLKTFVDRKVGEYTPINRLSQYTEVFECKPEAGEIAVGDETSAIQYWNVNALPKDFFIIHREWLADALENKRSVLRKPISGVTYWNLFKHVLRHPVWVGRLLLSRCGFPINTGK
jgi:8-oxo-dGTP pyrophosphatase MutT (NUDIX family)